MRTIKLTVGILEICVMYYLSSVFGIMNIAIVMNGKPNIPVISVITLAMVTLGMAIQMIATRRSRDNGANLVLLIVSVIATALSVIGIVNDDSSSLNYVYAICNAVNVVIALFDMIGRWEKKNGTGQVIS